MAGPFFRSPGDANPQRALARRKAERERLRGEMRALSGRAREAGLSGMAAVLDLAEAMDPDAEGPPNAPSKPPEGR